MTKKKPTPDPSVHDDAQPQPLPERQQLRDSYVREMVDCALSLLKQTLRDPGDHPLMSTPDVVRDYLRLSLGPITDHEVFGVLWLDAKGRLIEDVRIGDGSMHTAHVNVKAVLRSALEYDAHGAILYHNHPSGDPEPSDNDKRLTNKIAELLEAVEIELIDHLIVGTDANLEVASLRELAVAEEKAEEQEKRMGMGMGMDQHERFKAMMHQMNESEGGGSLALLALLAHLSNR